MSTLCFYAQFTQSKVGVNSLTVTWDIERITRSDGTRSALVTGGSTSVTVGRRGLYGYLLTDADLSLYDYIATAITATSTVDLQEVPALWTLWSISWHDVATSVMTIVGSIGKFLVDSVTAIKASTDNLPSDPADQSLLTASINAIPSAIGGSGSIDWSDQLVITVSGLPRDGVEVRVTTDSAGNNIVASGSTNAFGKLESLMLDAGTYYVWCHLAGVNFTNPQTEVVS